jgi:uncharacterized protein with NRDE domain
MCLILLAREARPDWPLVLAANRDEYFRRPTRAAHYWEDIPAVLGGRDLEAGGSWLGVDAAGRLAAVTNYREPPQPQPGLDSRGGLVVDYFRQQREPLDYLREVARRRRRYAAFNLLVGRGADLYFYSSRASGPQQLGTGIYGISNGDLDCPWPKVNKGKRLLREHLGSGHAPDSEVLFDLLADRTPAGDGQLPDTGVDLETERKLSPIFINLDGYGTRSSTVVIMAAAGRVFFAERNYDENGAVIGTGRFEFDADTG